MAIAMLRAPSMEDVVMHDAAPLSAFHCHGGGTQPNAERRVWYAPAPAAVLPVPAPAPPPPSPVSADLPTELLLAILGDPALGPRDLARACRISRRWLHPARAVLYGARPLPVSDLRLASTLWNSTVLRALARRVHLNLDADGDAVSAVGWLCLPGAAPRELAIAGSCQPAAVAQVLASPACAPALAHLRRLATTLPIPIRLDIAPALEDLALAGDALHLLERCIPPRTAATLRSLTLRLDGLPATPLPLPLARFAALRRLELTCICLGAPGPAPAWTFGELPHTLEVLVLSICLLPDPTSRNPWPTQELELHLVPPGVLTRPMARALAQTHTLRVRCDAQCASERGARDLLLPVD